MEEQMKGLHMYFKKSEVQCPEEINDDDGMLIEGEYWEFKDPEQVQAWSFYMIPFKDHMCLSFKFKNAAIFIQLSYEEKVKDVEADSHPMIKVQCVTTIPGLRSGEQYHFTICFDSVLIPFNLTPFLESLEPTPYGDEVKELEKGWDKKEWQNANGTPLAWKRLCAKIRHMFNDFSTIKGKLEMQNKMNAPRSVSMEIVSQGVSQSSMRNQTPASGSGRGKRNKHQSGKSTAQGPGNSPLASSSAQRPVEKSSEQSGLGEVSGADEMENVPQSRATDRKPDYKHVTEVYQKFWTTCEDAYVFKIEDKKEIDISQLIEAPATFNIRSKEDRIVEDMVNYLVNIPDKSTKQALCVMPVGYSVKPTRWEDIEGGQFYIINGQHSVAASKFMMQEDSGIDDDMREHFKKWNCFVVWSADAEKLRCISSYYNRVNHFQAIQPSWATNILGARAVWQAMGSPRNPKEATSVGTVSISRRTIENHRNTVKFHEFEKAVYVRFSMIDVNKNHKLAKKRNKEEKLKLVNELKLITAPNDVYKLWSDVISDAAHGELFNPDTDKKFNARKDWNPESCMLTREFFKFLGNLSYDELGKLAKHILNQSDEKRTHAYPKVTIKSISSVLDSCYTTKEWAERRKRKHLVKKELHQIDPTLGLLNAKNEIIVENWKAFKKDRFITKATMNVLLDRPGEAYFAAAKQVRARNMTAAKLSPMAAEFFKVFMAHRNAFVKPTASGHYRTYEINSNRHSAWNTYAWTAETSSRMSLGVMDFRNVPGIEKKEKSTVDRPYFMELMASLRKAKKPTLEEVPSWLFICSDEKEQAQVLHFVETNEVLKTFNCEFANYAAGKNDRLGDQTASKTPKKVLLMFLQNPTNVHQVEIPSEFNCPDTPRYTKPRAYSELEYRIYNTELRMEFYLWLVKKFCNPGMCVFSGFARGKLTCAAMMSCVDVYVSGPAEESFWWDEICTKALTLDKCDFLDTGYPVNVEDLDAQPGSQSTPSSSGKRKLRSSQDSPGSKQKRKPAPVVEDVEELSDDDEDDDDRDYEEEGGLDCFTTPTSRPSADVPGSSASSMPPPAAVTPRTPSTSRQSPKKRKRETITSVVKQLAECQMQTAQSLQSIQRQNELALAEMRAEQAKERLMNMQMHEDARKSMESTQAWMREEGRQNRELIQALLQRNNPVPVAAVQPASPSPPLLIQSQPSGSNNSGASSPPEPVLVPPPLPVESPISAPLPADEREGGDVEAAATEAIEVGHNLTVDASEEELGSGSLRTGDSPTGLAVNLQSLFESSQAPPAQSHPSSLPDPQTVDEMPPSTDQSTEQIEDTSIPDPTPVSREDADQTSGSTQRKESDPPVARGGTSEGVGRPLRSRAAEKWINVVLDLNGILCVCEDWKSKGSIMQFNHRSEPHSATDAAVVGPKAVYVRPNCSTFLKELQNIALVSVWTSMKKSTAEDVCSYLFRDGEMPFLVLGQDSCKTIKCRDRAGRLISYKEPGTDKDLFLKNLDVLFGGLRGSFTYDNTVIVDDSPRKHIMNMTENVVLSDSWTNRGNGDKDTFLVAVLLPWFQRLHVKRDVGLKAFRKSGPGKIGRKMLCEERGRREYDKLMEGKSTSPNHEPDADLTCQASADSIMDYGQYVILSTGNFLCSAPTANSSMDFSVKTIEDGVVDNPPNGKPRVPVSCSPSPLRSRELRDPPMSPSTSDRVAQRRLYGDANYQMSTPELKPKGPDGACETMVPRPIVPHSLSRQQEPSKDGRLKRKHDGPSCSQCSTPTWDSWERKSLQAQRREHAHQGGKIAKGYSRGPEILKAMEKLKRTSHT